MCEHPARNQHSPVYSILACFLNLLSASFSVYQRNTGIKSHDSMYSTSFPGSLKACHSPLTS